MRITKLVLAAVLATSFLVCCDKPLAAEKVVANTAKLYYEYLLEGKYDEFVAGIDRRLSPSDSYNAQMRDNAKMFVHRQKELHKGIEAISAVNAEVDKKAHSANAFLVIQYSDSTSEQVVVPMLARDGVWLMG